MTLFALPIASMAADEPDAGNTAAGGNVITVTGNTASNVGIHCDRVGKRRPAEINSVNVNTKALQGETIIITGRNVRDVDLVDCQPDEAGNKNANVRINSVRIR